MSKNAEERIIRLTEEEIEKVVGGNNRSGIECTECGFFIEVSIPALLTGEPVVCPACGFIMKMH